MFKQFKTLLDKLLAIRFLRFAIVGGFSGGVYALAVILITMFTSLESVIASVIGYLIAIPTNFIGQKKYAFRSKEKGRSEFVRFFVVQIANIGVTALVTHIVTNVLGWSFYVGIALVISAIPFSTYLCLKFFVFAVGETEQRKSEK